MISGQIYLTLGLANAAITAASATYSYPPLADIDGGYHIPWAQLAQGPVAKPMQLLALTWFVPTFDGIFIGANINIGDLISITLP